MLGTLHTQKKNNTSLIWSGSLASPTVFPSFFFFRRHSVCSPRVREAWFLFSPKFDWVAHEGLGVIAISLGYNMLQPAQPTTHCGVTGEPLRIPREDWGNLREHWGKLGQSLPLLRILLTQLTCQTKHVYQKNACRLCRFWTTERSTISHWMAACMRQEGASEHPN